MVQQWPVPTRHLKNSGYNAAQLPLTAVLQKLDAGGEVTGHIEERIRRQGGKPQKVVVFWL
jgi:hypothetical protein